MSAIRGELLEREREKEFWDIIHGLPIIHKKIYSSSFLNVCFSQRNHNPYNLCTLLSWKGYPISKPHKFINVWISEHFQFQIGGPLYPCKVSFWLIRNLKMAIGFWARFVNMAILTVYTNIQKSCEQKLFSQKQIGQISKHVYECVLRY